MCGIKDMRMKLGPCVNVAELLIYCIGLAIAVGLKGVDNGGVSCSPWFIPQSDDSGNSNCTCGSSLRGIVTCSEEPDNMVHMMKCYCMTSDHYNRTVVGGCIYSCLTTGIWYPDPSELNYQMCSEVWNRTGTLCSECKDGHGPLVYSYDLNCVPCPSTHSVVLFIGQFALLMLFCLIILTLRISIARPPISTFVLVSQVMAAPYLPQYMFTQIPGESISNNTIHYISWSLLAAFYGVWNLDIFRSFYPHICLNPNMSTLQTILLEYVMALFPLFMLILIYHIVNLYDGGCRVVFWLFRPFHTCLARLRQSIDIRTSSIDAFATFIILSFNKIGYTSVSILQPVYVYTPYGNHTTAVYLDPRMSYFGSQHLPYALLALTLAFSLIIVPITLLLVYPLRCFQKFLNNQGWQCYVLNVFADSFQGCYKDGTSGTRDYRWFAVLNMCMRFVTIVPSIVTRFHRQLTYSLIIIGVTLYMTLLAIFQPYKKPVHLKQDMVLLLGLIIWHTAIKDDSVDVISWETSDIFLHRVILAIASLIPAVYIVGLILYWLLVVKQFHKHIMNKLRQIKFSSENIRLLDDSA